MRRRKWDPDVRRRPVPRALPRGTQIQETSAVMNDLRSHVVPGVDDGSASLEGSFAALACMGEQGVRPLVVTPRVGDSLRPRPEALAPPSLEPPPPLGALR